MSDTGQSTERLRAGLQAFASLIGLRRRYDGGRGEDLLAEPVPESVEFTSLSPLTASSQTGGLYSFLNDAWVKRHCEPYIYENAGGLVNLSSVVLLACSSERLSGKVRDTDVFSVEIWSEQNEIRVSCECDRYRRRSETSNTGYQRMACVHIAALARYCITAALIPNVSPGNQTALCPVTRLPLGAGRAIYQCDRCKLNFSLEGWQFLKQMDRGRCCGCQGRNCIHLLRVDEECQHAVVEP